MQTSEDNLVDSMLPTTHSKQKCSFCSFRFVEFLSLPQVAELLGSFPQSTLHVFLQPMHLAGSVGEWDCVFLGFCRHWKHRHNLILQFAVPLRSTGDYHLWRAVTSSSLMTYGHLINLDTSGRASFQNSGCSQGHSFSWFLYSLGIAENEIPGLTSAM